MEGVSDGGRFKGVQNTSSASFYLSFHSTHSSSPLSYALLGKWQTLVVLCFNMDYKKDPSHTQERERERVSIYTRSIRSWDDMDQKASKDKENIGSNITICCPHMGTSG